MPDSYRRPGFTIPGYAAAAAAKGHRHGWLREWTPDEARAQGRKGGRPKRAADEAARTEPQHERT